MLSAKTTQTSGKTKKTRRSPSRSSRRREGLVEFFGLDTLGVDGPATVIVTPGACPACIKAKEALPSHRCNPSEPVLKAIAKGLVYPRRVEGDWILELTSEGLRRATEIDSARRRGNRR